MDETKQFLEELDSKPENILDKLDAPDSVVEPIAEVKEPEEDNEFKAKNRRERRLVEQNQRLREEAIASRAREEALAEARKINEGTQTAEYLKLLEPIYGNREPGQAEATELLKKAFQGMKDENKREILEELAKRESDESKAVEKEEEALDEILDNVEDKHGIDFSQEATRQGYLTLMEKLSPKDREGNIIEYADGDAVAEVFKSTQKQSNQRAKDLADRSMVRSGASQPSKLEDDATVKYLKEIGVI